MVDQSSEREVVSRPMATKKTDYEMDERGVALNNEYSPGEHPTTMFHPDELPANLTARAAFPKHLIGTEYTQSPSGDATPEQRRATAERSLAAEREKLERWEDEVASVKNYEPPAIEAPEEPVVS
jgi:hypothetical protein